jgi:hypothetical protein
MKITLDSVRWLGYISIHSAVVGEDETGIQSWPGSSNNSAGLNFQNIRGTSTLLAHLQKAVQLKRLALAN